MKQKSPEQTGLAVSCHREARGRKSTDTYSIERSELCGSGFRYGSGSVSSLPSVNTCLVPEW